MIMFRVVLDNHVLLSILVSLGATRSEAPLYDYTNNSIEYSLWNMHKVWFVKRDYYFVFDRILFFHLFQWYFGNLDVIPAG